MKLAVASHHVEHVDGTDDGLDGVHVAGDVQLEHCGQQQTHTLLNNKMRIKLASGKSTAIPDTKLRIQANSPKLS